jgi:signal transduction histidine kinase
VQDTGIGIEKHKLAELFNKFHQVDNSASRKHEGTGLGLVLTKELLELHGGEISVDSEEGIGTTFAFRLPMQVRVTSENPQLV